MNNFEAILNELNFKSTDTPTMTREEFEQWQINRYNASEGNLHLIDGIECEVCKNKGGIQFLNQGKYLTIKDCECMKRRRIVKRALNSGLGSYLKKTLKDYEATEDWQQHNKLKALNFMKEHTEDNTWFMCVGTSGSGKTLLCSIIANHLLYKAGKYVTYLTWTDFISRLKRDVMSDQADEVSKYLEEIKNVEVLFLDELIKKFNETDLKYLIEIINYRYTNDLKTIITSEKVLTELLDIDEATFSRAVEKCEGYFINIPKDRKKNYRLKDLL